MLIHLEHSLFRKCIINYDLNNGKTTKNQCTMNNSESKDIPSMNSETSVFLTFLI